ncbi:flagellar biosynthesis anti-sigma factor FlgM [Psychrosphaera ytuae]|uniref:Negative regulator of flagellin synthesis n=1 Tax=Psychrosphaera ytuae TaxID=2820710 RepID=A0A975DCX8_9GAMM|nr:flagellar biosynthesis anti-sigma factor FlgM [Psychrosphaera ytuae]QTH64654.1 flagellar biosynthesis anti-sigma factor FlgM [Psychrosphaera ytuae]
MVNNINNGKNSGVNNSVYSPKNQKLEQLKQDNVQQSQQQTASSKAAEKDSVALTPQAKQLKDLQKKISDTENFDRKKVEEIKQAITDGNYKINYDKLAQKLADFEFKL